MLGRRGCPLVTRTRACLSEVLLAEYDDLEAQILLETRSTRDPTRRPSPGGLEGIVSSTPLNDCVCPLQQLAEGEAEPPEHPLRRVHGTGRDGRLRVHQTAWQGPQGKGVCMTTALPVSRSVVTGLQSPEIFRLFTCADEAIQERDTK